MLPPLPPAAIDTISDLDSMLPPAAVDTEGFGGFSEMSLTGFDDEEPRSAMAASWSPALGSMKSPPLSAKAQAWTPPSMTLKADDRPTASASSSPQVATQTAPKAPSPSMPLLGRSPPLSPAAAPWYPPGTAVDTSAAASPAA